MTKKYRGELEIDTDRGVIYFHLHDKETCLKIGSVSMLRISKLPTPIPEQWLDLSNCTVNYDPKRIQFLKEKKCTIK